MPGEQRAYLRRAGGRRAKEQRKRATTDPVFVCALDLALEKLSGPSVANDLAHRVERDEVKVPSGEVSLQHLLLKADELRFRRALPSPEGLRES